MGVFFSILTSFVFAGACFDIDASVQTFIRLNLGSGEILAPVPPGRNIVTDKSESLFGNVQPVDLGQVQALRWIAKQPWTLEFNQLIVSSGRLQSRETHAMPLHHMKRASVESSIKHFLSGRGETFDGPKRDLSNALEITYDRAGRLEKIEDFSSAGRISLNDVPEALKLNTEISFIRNSRGRENGILIENHTTNEFFNGIGAALQTVYSSAEKGDPLKILQSIDDRMTQAREHVKHWRFHFFRYLDFRKIENILFQVVDFGTTISGRSQLESKLDSRYNVAQFFDLGTFGSFRWIEVRRYRHLKQPRVGKRDEPTSSLILAYEATTEGFAFRGIVEAAGHRFEHLERDPKTVENIIDAVTGEDFSRPLTLEFADAKTPMFYVEEILLRTVLETALRNPMGMSFSDIQLPIFVQSSGFDRAIPYPKRMTPLERQKWPFPIATRPR